MLIYIQIDAGIWRCREVNKNTFRNGIFQILDSYKDSKKLWKSHKGRQSCIDLLSCNRRYFLAWRVAFCVCKNLLGWKWNLRKKKVTERMAEEIINFKISKCDQFPFIFRKSARKLDWHLSHKLIFREIKWLLSIFLLL